MAAVTKNRNFFNCPLLLKYKLKWAQILTAATWQGLVIPPLAEWSVYWNTLVRPSVRLSLNLVYVTNHLSFVGVYSYLVSWLTMIWACTYYTDFTDGWFFRVIALLMFVWPYVRPHILCTQLVICLFSHFIHIWYLGWPWSEHALLYQFHGWLIFPRVIALFMYVWPYVRSHILCTQLIICLLSHFIHIWYPGWPWSEHAHNIPISRMADFCESYSPFHVCLTIRPFTHLVYATSHSYLVSWLAMIWACAYYTNFTDGWFLWEL